jgi:Tol biopolymer transport system component
MTERVPPPPGQPADGYEQGGLSVTISPDGRYVGFSTHGDADTWDGPSYIFDRSSKDVFPVAVAADGGTADGTSGVPTFSADGRYIAFSSTATNVVADDTNKVSDVFRRDLVSGKTLRASTPTGGGELKVASYAGMISADGTVVSFSTSASTVLGKSGLYIHNFANHITVRVPAPGEPIQVGGSLSRNGRYVVLFSGNTSKRDGFWIDGRLVFADTFAGTYYVVSPWQWLGDIGVDRETKPSISADGSTVVFDGYPNHSFKNGGTYAARIKWL